MSEDRIDSSADDRLTTVETAIMHLQRDMESLSDSLLHHGRLLDELQKSLDKLSSTVEELDSDDQRDPEDEVPPHY